MKNLDSLFYDESIRVGQIIWLAANFDQPCEALTDFFESEDLAVIAKTLGVAADTIKMHLGGEADFSGLMSHLAGERITGFLVRAETPIPQVFHDDGAVDTFGFGRCTRKWFYTETIDAAFGVKLVAWKYQYYAKQRRAASKKKGGAK